MKRGKSYFYASHNPYGITAINRGGQSNKLHRFSFKASRDKFISEDPEHREPVPGRSPVVRLARRLEQTQQIEWPFEYQD
jgi:hypothetical protein